MQLKMVFSSLTTKTKLFEGVITAIVQINQMQLKITLV